MSHNTRPQLNDVPDMLLVKVASYLSSNSCLSFAVAVTPSSPHDEPSATAKAIIISQQNWECVDFKDIQQQTYMRDLRDSDIRWILLCVDAVNKVKSIKFTHCVEIIGSGLEPLRGSNVLESIDLSLVGDHENPTISPPPLISEANVVPILDSIVRSEGHSLVHVQLPKKWRLERGEMLTNFLKRFDQAMNGRRLKCSGNQSDCDEFCEGNDEFPLVHWQVAGGYDAQAYSIVYGMTSISCYLCKKNFCGSCHFCCNPSFCKCCEKFYCNDCSEVLACDRCRDPQPSSCKVCDTVREW